MAAIPVTDSLSEIGLTSIISNLHDVVLLFPVVILIIGLFYCFLGKKLFDVVNFLVGGLVALGVVLGLSGLSGPPLYISSLAAFLVGGIIGFFLPYLVIGLVGFSIGVALLASLSTVLAFLGGIIFAVLLIALFVFFLPLLTTFFGATISAYAILELTGSELISIVAGIFLFVSGVLYQYFYADSDVRKN